MLVLSRKSSERITIGDNIAIEIRRIAGNRVTLAIDAPRDIRILRGELEAVAKEFEAAEPTETQTSQAVEPAETYHVSHRRVPLAQSLTTSPAPTSAVG